jgi:hypothetical protein
MNADRRRMQPTSVSIVWEYLTKVNDFVTAAQIREVTRLDSNHASAALYCLKKYRAVECFESDDVLWWFATPQYDQRSRTVDERTPESKPRKKRTKKPE